MVFPISNYTRVWVRGRMIDLAKAAREETSYGVTGPVQFIPSPNVLVDQGTDQVIDTKPFVVFPNASDGYFEIKLPATNDPEINPTGWTYHVYEPTGRDYHIVVPHDTPAVTTVGDPLIGQQVIELSDIVPNPTANPGTVQVLAGIAGRGISSMAVNGSNRLIITYTDATTQDAGVIPSGLDAEGVRDTIGTALVGSGLITVTPNDGADTITVSTTATAYTDELARDAIGTALVAGSGVSIVVNDGLDTITVSNSDGDYRPSDHGYVGWTFDPAMSTGSSTLATAGVLHLFQLKVPVAATISKVVMRVATAGATLTNTYVAIYDSAGTRRAVSANESTNFQSSGYKEISMVGSYAAPAGTYYVGFLVGSAATLPTLTRNASSNAVNDGLSAGSFRWATSGTGLTAAPSTVTLGSTAALNVSYWAALKV